MKYQKALGDPATKSGEIHEQITNSNEYTKNAKSEYEKNSNIQSLDKNSNIKI